MLSLPICREAFLWCAMHDDKLDGASPLWGFVITNH